MQLYLNEQDGDELIKLFDELDELTREPFQTAKAEIDAQAGGRTAASSVDDLRPWHYHDPFFQESPAVFDANLDAPFAKADILQALPRLLRRHRPADRRRDRPQRPLREEGQEPARLLHRHRPRGRRPRAGQHRAQRILDGHDAARARPRRLQQQEHPADAALRAARRGAHPDDRRRGDDVRAVQQVAGVAGEDGREGRRRRRRSTRRPRRCSAINC